MNLVNLPMPLLSLRSNLAGVSLTIATSLQFEETNYFLPVSLCLVIVNIKFHLPWIKKVFLLAVK
jgi:hypothetical protein